MNVVSIVIAAGVGFALGFGIGSARKSAKEEPRKAEPVSKAKTRTKKPAMAGKKDISNIYVGNLSPEVTDKDLRETFEVFGKVQEATIIKDRSKGGYKRFAFVEMFVADEAQAAIKSLDGRDLKGRTLKVKEAHNRGTGGRSSRPRGGSRRNPKRRTDKRPQPVNEA